MEVQSACSVITVTITVTVTVKVTVTITIIGIVIITLSSKNACEPGLQACVHALHLQY